ncbi:zinc finger a20 and an1 domain-containing stress-associated protein 8 [Phtheirospermum japonicum]|uniref:Zinc finger a20 and an1 domain-containing stress-associated protein 8 n=1 Tax=Phtheirospermum japonicum TaxID=374723 RepID=A0A830C9H2_9LAMI|nr:zinc finger a20 and an1 domain-containing stress-associated protein 8 [Phtheirospermum japonicum]
MNMCSKCYKDMTLKQEQAKAAASSIEDIVNGLRGPPPRRSPLLSRMGPLGRLKLDAPKPTEVVEPKTAKVGGPSRCTTCKKQVGLTGFKCRCSDLFCGSHRYSDKHDCTFDYRTAGHEAIAKANPVVKAEKLDKI